MKYLRLLFGLFLLFSCASDDDNNNSSSVIKISVDEVSKNGASISWTVPTNITSQSVIYKITLDNKVIVDNNYRSRQFTFTKLQENKLYSGSIFWLDDNGEEGFSDFSFTTEKDPIFLGELILNNQSEVDNFYYTNVTALVIDGKDITDLSKLETLEFVERYVIIKNTSLKSLNGLHNVKTRDDLFGHLPTLEISENNGLEDFSAITGFAKKVIDLSLVNNPKISSLGSLEIKENLNILSLINLSINNLRALSNLKSANFLRLQNLKIDNLDGLDSIEKVFDLNISNNPNLQSLNGAVKLQNKRGETLRLFILKNQVLSDFCGIKELMNNAHIFEDDLEGRLFWIRDNLYNPTEEEIKREGCTQ